VATRPTETGREPCPSRQRLSAYLQVERDQTRPIQSPFNPKVAGSIPARPTTKSQLVSNYVHSGFWLEGRRVHNGYGPAANGWSSRSTMPATSGGVRQHRRRRASCRLRSPGSTRPTGRARAPRRAELWPAGARRAGMHRRPTCRRSRSLVHERQAEGWRVDHPRGGGAVAGHGDTESASLRTTAAKA
jgi:hypothetical protein